MIADMSYARDFARTHKSWVVLVVPEHIEEDALKVFAGVANGFPFGGRTVAFPDGGKMTLIRASSPVFVPEGEPFDMMTFGWGRAKNTEGVEAWRKACRSVLARP